MLKEYAAVISEMKSGTAISVIALERRKNSLVETTLKKTNHQHKH